MDKTIKTTVSIDYKSLEGNFGKKFGKFGARPTGIGRSWKKRLWLPVSAYLIEHPKGLILLDTG